MASDMTTALADIVQANGAWEAQRITLGRDTVLEGEALRQAVAEAAF